MTLSRKKEFKSVIIDSSKFEKILKELGKKKSWVARQLGVSDRNLYYFIDSRLRSSKINIDEVCKLLECKPDDIKMDHQIIQMYYRKATYKPLPYEPATEKLIEESPEIDRILRKADIYKEIPKQPKDYNSNQIIKTIRLNEIINDLYIDDYDERLVF